MLSASSPRVLGPLELGRAPATSWCQGAAMCTLVPRRRRGTRGAAAARRVIGTIDMFMVEGLTVLWEPLTALLLLAPSCILNRGC